MLEQINIHEVKTHLSRLVDEVVDGKTFIIAKSGKPMAMVVPYKPETPLRTGFYHGEFALPDDFDRFSENEVANLFGVSK